jgi:hypothetical protein
MSSAAKWWSRATAAVTGVILMMVVPAHAWAASNGVADVAGELARKRGGFKAVGVVGLLCCLVVVGGIALAIFLIMKKRGKRPPH